MFRIDDPSASNTLPTPEAAGTEGYFTEGNPPAGTPATDVRASFLNMLQEELRNIVTGAGLTPSKTTYNQVLTAIQTLMQTSAPRVSAAGGTADALTGSFTPAVTTLVNGMTLYVRAANANATTTPTFTPASGVITAKTIVKGNGLALAAGDIAGAGHWIEMQYDLSLDKWVLLNPAGGVNTLGFGQTAQNVLASRAWSTTYTNTTGRPIFVCVAGSVTTAGAAVQIAVNGIQFVGTSDFTGGNAAYISSAFAIVPPGGTYSVGVTSSTVGTLYAWSELR